jgi:hypothetical protein
VPYPPPTQAEQPQLMLVKAEQGLTAHAHTSNAGIGQGFLEHAFGCEINSAASAGRHCRRFYRR